MSEEIHFLEDGYYVDKLEKDIEKLKEKCNQLQTMVKTYKEVIDETRKYVEQHDYDYIYLDCKFIETHIYDDLLQILDKVKEK